MTELSLQSRLDSLIALSVETEWVEFKHNNDDPEMIGEYLSALSNSAVLHDQQRAWLVWGVRDGDHEVIGTTFKPREAKVGNQDLEGWLSTKVFPRLLPPRLPQAGFQRGNDQRVPPQAAEHARQGLSESLPNHPGVHRGKAGEAPRPEQPQPQARQIPAILGLILMCRSCANPKVPAQDPCGSGGHRLSFTEESRHFVPNLAIPSNFLMYRSCAIGANSVSGGPSSGSANPHASNPKL